MPFKKLRLGPELVRQASREALFQQAHAVIGGTGAVGGAAVLELVGMFEEALRYRTVTTPVEPRVIVTGRSHHDLHQFTRVFYQVQERDHGRPPERLEGRGYRSVGGVLVELVPLAVDPSVPGLEGFSRLGSEQQREAIAAFLAAGGLTPQAPTEEQAAWLEQALAERVVRPFSAFLESYRAEHGLPGGAERFRSVIVGIPLASLAAYKLGDLEEVGRSLGLDPGSARLEALKDRYLAAIRDDLAAVKAGLAEEVLAAHTTAVGGMYDLEPESRRTIIRLGFAHSALDDRLIKKQEFAAKLQRLYAEREIKMLVTAAAIGIDAILVRKSPAIAAAVRHKLERQAIEGHPVVPVTDLGSLHVYRPVELDLVDGSSEPVRFDHGRPLVLGHVVRSGENGYFTVSNADALYRVMRVTSGGELGLALARVALLGDDPHAPTFVDSVCYYTETDNSRQVLDLLSQPWLRRHQLAGLEPKALQDLGSAKHQAELHLLGLVILWHRLKSLDWSALPAEPEGLRTFSAEAYFEANSQPPTLEDVASWELPTLARELTALALAREEDDLRPLSSFASGDPELHEAAHRVYKAVLQAVWAVPSIGTPVVYERNGRRKVVAGPYAAAIDHVVARRDTFAAFLRDRFAELGGGDDEAFDRFVEFHIANNGFLDLRPRATLVSTKSDTQLAGKVQVCPDEASFRAALAELEPYSYFTSSGLVATLVRLKGLARRAAQLDPSLGTANTYRAQIPHDEEGRALLVPGVVEAFRMVSEGLEKNTGAERLDGYWGY